MKPRKAMIVLIGILAFSLICASAVAISKGDLITQYRSQPGSAAQRVDNTGIFPDTVVIPTPAIWIPDTKPSLPSRIVPDFLNPSSRIVRPHPGAKPTVLPTPATSSVVVREKITSEKAVGIAMSSMKEGYSGTGCDVQFTVTGIRMGAGAPAYATKNPYWMITLNGRYTKPATCMMCGGLTDRNGTIVSYMCSPVGGMVIIDSVTGDVLETDHYL
jgi:hypothetical protein